MRRSPVELPSLPVLRALGLAIALAAGCRAGAGPEVPTYTVRAERLALRVPAEGNLEAVRATQLAVPTDAPGPLRITWLAPDGARVRAGEVVARFDGTDLARDLAAAEGDLTIAREKDRKAAAEAAAALADLDREAGLARSELAAADRFQKKDELVFSRHEILESAVDRELAEAREANARAARSTRARQAEAERALVAIDARKADLAIARSRRGLAAVEVRAAHDGLLVIERDFRNELVRPGDTVFPGQAIAWLPDLARMRAQVFVLEADAAGLERGKPALVTLESRPDAPIPARVERVDALAKPRFRGSPVQYFAVDLALDRTDPAIMKPGARVRASIEVDTRRHALAIPRQALFEREGQSVVFRRSARGFLPVAVATAPAGPGLLAVVSGLAAGDVVALVDPAQGAEPKPKPDGSPAPGAGAATPEGGA